jgi:RecA-family ATPase
MTHTDQAARYLAKIPPAISGAGGHAQTLSAARALVWGFNLPAGDARSLLMDWNRGCQPPWSESEIEHKLSDADRIPFDKPRGYLIRNGHSKPGHAPHTLTPPAMPKASPAPKAPQRAYVLTEHDLPEPMPDSARTLLRSVFQAGEGVRVSPAVLNDDGKEIPDGSGIVLSREEWLRKLDSKDGDLNGIFYSSKRTGIYVSINPMRLGGSRDADVTDFRHALIEFDNISPTEQFNLYAASRIPCAAVINSGGKSIHAWVKIEAKDRQEYDERVRALYDHFKGAGYALDDKNKNPSRFSRMPGCVRFDRHQELLALDMGCESFTEWLAEVQADGIGTVTTVEQLDAFNVEHDPNTLLGNRWLCKGGSAILVAPSGVGKSSMSIQFAASWAIGRPAFGIAPVRALKILIVQAENDDGDLAEMVRGVRAGLGIDPFATEAEYAQLNRNLVFVRDTTHTGFEFTAALRRLIDRHKPDLVIFDPLLSFIGADISKQEVCSEFLRNWLNPIADATGVAWLAIHHTGKPPGKDDRKGWQSADWSYAGIGSSELTNWARAVMVLRQVRGEYAFELKLSKRGKRAGATHPDGTPTTSVWVRHAQAGIYWEQIDPPEEPEADTNTPRKSPGRPAKASKLDGLDLHPFRNGCLPDGESQNSISKRFENWLATQRVCVSQSTATKLIVKLVETGEIIKGQDGKFRNGTTT